MPFAHLQELYGNRDGEDLTRTDIKSLFPSLFSARDASKQRPHGSEPPVARTGQHPWTSQDGLQFKHQIRPVASGVRITIRVLPQYYFVQQVEPCHQFG